MTWVAVGAAVVLVAAVALLVSEIRHRRRKHQMIELIPSPRRESAEIEEPAEPASDPYLGRADTDVLTECPYVNAPGGRTPLRDWLRHFAGIDAWSVVVARFYTRAAADPEIADYFRGVDVEQLQRHFLAALMIVTSQGVTVGVVRRMQAAHVGVTNTTGEPVTPAVWDAVIAVLAQVLGEVGTPRATLVALTTTIGPLRAVIVVDQPELLR